ncbi:MAG TPA: hypothetical protein VHB30_11970 [Solirubrobacteraceae bacterium]|jgi:hypothetical protein|nr:hypothetical protein [Solirubrobacteraceae bacterium]
MGDRDASPHDEPSGSARTIEQLRAEARFAGERLDLYRAKVYGPRPTSMTRLRELERAHQRAQDRLRHALARIEP